MHTLANKDVVVTALDRVSQLGKPNAESTVLLKTELVIIRSLSRRQWIGEDPSQ